ncbi:MAG: AAA-like domain-containing protein [Cyanobacteria bacterium P01_G01_bin.67]
MSRSLKVSSEHLEKVKFSLLDNSFPSQRALALHLGLALSTVSRFCTGKPVDYGTFVDICETLHLKWQDFADPNHSSQVSAKAKPMVLEESLPSSFNETIFTSSITEELDTIETATTQLELPEGQVRLGSRLYVERPPIESLCYKTVLKAGSLIRIKAPRQMGKSSLMLRILALALRQNYRIVTIDFQLADSKIFQDLDLFLKWLCVTVSKRLDLSNEVDKYWDDIFGSKMSCNDYFENYLLANIDQPLVLALESVDLIFPHIDIADDFFALLRSWHEEAKWNSIWQQLRLILVHSTEVYIPLSINRSPFNVGLPIELPEFDLLQIIDLAQRQGLDWNSEQVKQIMDLLGGHPFLIRIALYHLANQDFSLSQLLSVAATETSPFNNHLRRLLWNLQQQSNLLVSWQIVIESNASVYLDSIKMFKLHSMGLVHIQGNEVIPRCELYRQYFRNRLN